MKRNRIQHELVTIDPATAKQWLDQSDWRNRHLDRKYVLSLAEQMQSEEWANNGETIKFSGNRLLDGQHRLSAIIEAGVTVEMLVVRSLDHTTFDTIDVGKRRTPGAIFGIEGIPHATVVVAAMKWAIRYDHNITVESRVNMTSHELLRTFRQEYPDLPEFIESYWKVRKQMPKGLVSAGVFFGFGYLIADASTDKAWAFLSRLADGANLPEAHPVLTLRKYLMDDIHQARRDRDRQFLWFTRAWNAFMEGRTIKYLRFCKLLDEFPQIVGRNSYYF